MHLTRAIYHPRVPEGKRKDVECWNASVTWTRSIASSHEVFCTYFSRIQSVDHTTDDSVRMRERQRYNEKNTLLTYESRELIPCKRFACDEHRAIFIQLLLLTHPKNGMNSKDRYVWKDKEKKESVNSTRW